MSIENQFLKILTSDDEVKKFQLRQLILSATPLSRLVEMYLQDNEGRMQNLAAFPMLRDIYDHFPDRLLLKCSRKTLKSTLLSNIITLYLIRYNFYKMLYIAPLEKAAKYFSQNYLNVRFDSPKLKNILPPFIKNDVFEKILSLSNSSVLLTYVKDDPSRIRGPATDHNIYDEVQEIDNSVLPVVKETMALSSFKREIFAGTPQTTDNTIHKLWTNSTQYEWVTKCLACNHWNSLTEDNEPIKMIGPDGLCCSKCGRLIDTETGQWAKFNTSQTGLVAYHLAQPILPFFNKSKTEWEEIYNKVHNKAYGYSTAQIYNEVFGLSYDMGAKRITEEFLKNKCCILGKSATLMAEAKRKYRIITCGVDWGVNMHTSRTSVCMGGLNDKNEYHVFYAKIITSPDYEQTIKEIARIVNNYNAFCACDASPDPIRGIMLAKKTSPTRTQLVRYEYGKFVQRYEKPPNAIDWSQCRWCLHRTDTMSFVFYLLEKNKILFPQWDEVSECMQDILNVRVEIRDSVVSKQHLFYTHKDNEPDDFFHALNFAVCQAYVAAGDRVLNGPSSSSEDLIEQL